MTTLNNALYRTIHKNKKSLELIAEEMDMSVSYLTRSALPDTSENPNGSGCRFPLKKLPALVRVTEDFQVLDHLEHSVGRVAFRLPKPHACSKEMHRIVMQEVAAFGEFIGEIEKDLQHSRLSDTDKERIIDDGYVVAEKLIQLIETVKKA